MVLSREKNFYRELIKLALPIAMQSVITFSISFSDNVMTARLGNAVSSGVYLANQIFLLLSMVLVGIEGTVLVISSQLQGAKKNDGAKHLASFGILLALSIAIVFTLLSVLLPEFTISIFTDSEEVVSEGADFLRILGFSFLLYAPSQAIAAAMRSVKKPKIPFFASLSALAINISLNYALIFGNLGFSQMGAFGAGISTLCARAVEFIILFIYAFFIDKELNLSLKAFLKIKRETVRSFFKVGGPIILSQLVWCINIFFASSVMGRFGSAVVAGVSAAMGLYNLSYVIAGGFSGAVGIVFSRLVGENTRESYEKMRNHIFSVQLVFLALGVLSFLVMQVFKLSFVSFWGISGEAIPHAISFINVLSVLSIGTAYQSAALNGIIKSLGDTRFILKTEAFFVFAIIIPFSILAQSFSVSPALVFALLKCDQLLKCPVAFFKIRKEFIGKSRRIPGGV